MNTLGLFGRNQTLFDEDIKKIESDLSKIVRASRFLVIGGAGSIGQAVTREIFMRNPHTLHVVDISENNLVELVRDIRSSFGYGEGDFRTFALDCGSTEFDALMASVEGYDYVFNLSALKHVRSEKDPFTLMRMIKVNILNTLTTLNHACRLNVKKYFCVSTDKATNPVNMMGASKRVMEMFLMRESLKIPISTARFANVAFSDGSLLHGFNQRILKSQPISAPNDVKRYFVTSEESGQLCLLSALTGNNRDIYFPKLDGALNLTKFSDIAIRYVESRGFTPQVCETEEEARSTAEALIKKQYWPVYFFESDTTGEKDFEEFFIGSENLDFNRFKSLGIIKYDAIFDPDSLDYFLHKIDAMRTGSKWEKEELVDLFNYMIPNFNHKETGKHLDQRM